MIQTSEDSSVNLPANDSTEHWIKTRSDVVGGQLCQIDIGNYCYIVGKTSKGQMLIHIRHYDRRDDGTIFPTQKGIALILKNGRNFSTVT